MAPSEKSKGKLRLKYAERNCQYLQIKRSRLCQLHMLLFNSYLKMNTFKRAEFRIAYKIFCLIIDWNGSDKLGFINERVHFPLAALPGNSESLRETRG